MKHGRWIIVLTALALVELSSAGATAEPKKAKPAAAASEHAVDVELLVELAGARTLPEGIDDTSPKLAKIVSVIEAGKLQSAFPLIAKYAKANKAHLKGDAPRQLASWIVRRALLVPDQDVYAAADRLRFARDGKLALAKYESGLSSKATTDLAPAFALTPYAEGAVAVTVLTKQKKVSAIHKELTTAQKSLAGAVKTAEAELKDLVSAKDAPTSTCLKSCADSKGQIQQELARFR